VFLALTLDIDPLALTFDPGRDMVMTNAYAEKSRLKVDWFKTYRENRLTD